MPHHLRQTVHHNINQDMDTEKIDRGHPSMADPEVARQLEQSGDKEDNHRAGKEGKKPPRGIPGQLEV